MKTEEVTKMEWKKELLNVREMVKSLVSCLKPVQTDGVEQKIIDKLEKAITEKDELNCKELHEKFVDLIKQFIDSDNQVIFTEQFARDLDDLFLSKLTLSESRVRGEVLGKIEMSLIFDLQNSEHQVVIEENGNVKVVSTNYVDMVRNAIKKVKEDYEIKTV